MECRQCGAPLDRPGDYCLGCHTANAETVVVDADRDRATVTILDGDECVLGEATVTTTPEAGEDEPRELRNFAGRITDEIHRKRPEAVYVAGDRSVIRRLRDQIYVDIYRVAEDDPVGDVQERAGERALEVDERPAREKIGGAHSTLIGGRDGQRIVREVASHPNVKKVVPGPIESGGGSSDGGVKGKATRADANGNVRVLIRDGSSVQENRIVTTAMNRETGERVRAALNELLEAADLAA
jgi:hypothetical protein